MLHRGLVSGGLVSHAPPSHRLSPVVASMGGRGGFGDSGLIMGPNGRPLGGPGGPQGPPGRLIIPGAPGQFNPQQQRQGRGPIGLDLSEPSSGPGQLPPAHKYRPPPGFMGDNVQDPALNTTDPQEMLNKLRNKAGQWHQLAKLLPVLYAKGIDSNTVAELTGVNPVDQNTWVVAGTVYDSIAAAKVDPSVLAWFDSDGEEKLIHFRFLPAERRAAAAQYIMQQNLDAPACVVLARAMKEWDRRPGERTGFNNSPGDCMAFKHLRDAVECRSAEEASEKLSLAFAAAISDSASERLQDWGNTELAERASSGGTGLAGSARARLTVLRLQQDELGFRPLAQIRPLSEATVEELQWAPRTSQEGAFGTFELLADSQATTTKWVALPQWKALALARHPVAVPLVDCAADPAVLAASRAKTEEEKKKLTGAGLLVVDTERGQASIDPDSYYLVVAPPGSSQQLQLMDGTQILSSEGKAQVVASVLFLCRPPNRESQITSAELLQL